MWLIYALLSAVFAALVSIFGKVGLNDLDANAATAIRAVIMALFLIAVVMIQGSTTKLSEVLMNRRALMFIACSGIAGALSWLFYFLALKHGQVHQVAPIDKLSVVMAVLLAVLIFGEEVSAAHWLGIALIAIGGLIIAIL